MKELGIRTDKTQFVQDVEGHIGVYEISEKWSKQLSSAVDVLDEDFPLLAAQELWDRWLPNRFSLRGFEEMLEDYLENEPQNRVLERFWEIWTAIRDHILLPYRYRSFEQFAEKLDFSYDMDAVFFDTEGDMIKECRERHEEDPECWDRLTMLYRDMLEHLTDMHEENKLNLRRSYAEAHFYKGDTTTAEALFKQLVEENPDSVWGYIGWGDMYNPQFNDLSTSDKDKALRFYRLGLEKSTSDRDVLEERIEELTVR